METTNTAHPQQGDRERLRQVRRDWYKAWRDAKMPPTQRVLLQAIYKRLGNDLYTKASQERLGQDIGRSARTVGRHLPALEEAGWIMRQERVTRSGRLSDLIHIAIQGDTSFFCPRPRQNVVSPPTVCQGEKDSLEKASEHSSEAACAREAGSKKPQRAAAPKPAKKAAARQEGKEPVLDYVRSLLASWKQLVKASPPSAKALSHYSAAELQTALAVLLVRMRQRVRSPKGLFLRILEATHCGEREPRNYSPAQLRQIAAGGLPEHARRVRRRHDHPALLDPDEEEPASPTSPAQPEPAQPVPAQPVPVEPSELVESEPVGPEPVKPASPPPAPEKREPGRQASQKRAAPGEVERSGSAGSGQAGQRGASSLSSGHSKAQRERLRALAIVAGSKEPDPGVMERLLQEVESIFLAAQVLAQQWGWSEAVAFGELHRVNMALQASVRGGA